MCENGDLALLTARKAVLSLYGTDGSSAELLPVVEEFNAGAEDCVVCLKTEEKGKKLHFVTSRVYLPTGDSQKAENCVILWLQRVANCYHLWVAFSSFLGYSRMKKTVKVSRLQFELTENQGKASIFVTFLAMNVRVPCKLTVKLGRDNLVLVRFTARNKESEWKNIAPDWKTFLHTVQKQQIDFGWVVIDGKNLIFTTESAFDLENISNFPAFARYFFELTSLSLGNLSISASKVREKPSYECEAADLIEESIVLAPDFDYEEQYNSSRKILTLRLPFHPRNSYEPSQEHLPFFLPYTKVQYNDKTYLEVNLENWVKVYKQSPVNLPGIVQFAMEMYDAQLCFDPFPWRAVYWRAASGQGYRLAPRVLKSCVVELTDKSLYESRVMQSWVDFVQKRKEFGLLAINAEIAKMELPISAFKFQQVDAPGLIIGKGGFGVVFMNVLGGEKVAIKGYNPSKEYNSKSVENEIQLMKKVNHPNIVKIYGVTEWGTGKMIVLERCESSLSLYVKKHKQLPASSKLSPSHTLSILLKVAKAISYLHDQQICHFDLKPQNVLMKTVTFTGSQAQEPKLSDFGMASKQRMDGTWRKPGYTVGYSAPEQLQGCNVGPHCDVWAFAMVAYFLIFEKGPYEDLKMPDDKGEKKKAYLREVCWNLRKPMIRPDFARKNPKLTYLLRHCWHSDPFCRPKMNEVVRRLEDVGAIDKD